MYFFKVNSKNGMLGLVLSKELDPIFRYYKITKVHKTQINTYNLDMIGSYLLFINGISMYNVDKEHIFEIKKKKTPCTFAISNNIKEIQDLINQLKPKSSSQSD